MTAQLPALLDNCYDKFDIFATENELVPSILPSPRQNQHIISRIIQKRRFNSFRAPAEVSAKYLSLHDQVKRSRFY